MKKLSMLLLVSFVLFASFTFAVQQSANVAAVEGATASSSFDLLKDWRAISLGVTMLVIVRKQILATLNLE